MASTTDGTLDAATANRVERLLSDEFGGFYDGFERYVTTPNQWGHEWRFGGTLGFGGKLHVNSLGSGLRVSCYPEDETPERRDAIDRVNAELARLVSAR
jgi:hypothetical protein